VGAVEAIYIAAERAQLPHAVTEARVVEGRGLVGDRYFEGTGTYSDWPGDGRHVTLVEIDALEAVGLDGASARRNLVTSGIDLNALVGHEFRVGEVLLRGTRLCEPCDHLERLTRPGVLRALVHRGGVRADVVTGGVIRVGDAVEPHR
jgi:MOSC domain-containing protein YiiM